MISTSTSDKDEEKSDDGLYISVKTAISVPSMEKIIASGVTSRESIKIIADNYRTIEFIVPKNTVVVKKGDILLKYESTELELRADRLAKDLELKSQILDRNKALDVHSAISKDEFNKIQIDVTNAFGELKEVQHKIKDSTKIAPFDCFVKHHNFINGSYVTNGQEVLTIFRKDILIVDLNVNMKDLDVIKDKNLLDKHATLYLSKNRKVQGKVIYFLNNADPFTASLPVIIEVADPDGSITSGEVCDVKIHTGIINKMFLLPEEAICGEEYDYHVFVIKNNIAHKIPISKHKKKGEDYYVTGISDGDVVVISGAHRLTNLCKVKI